MTKEELHSNAQGAPGETNAALDVGELRSNFLSSLLGAYGASLSEELASRESSFWEFPYTLPSILGTPGVYTLAQLDPSPEEKEEILEVVGTNYDLFRIAAFRVESDFLTFCEAIENKRFMPGKYLGITCTSAKLRGNEDYKTICLDTWELEQAIDEARGIEFDSEYEEEGSYIFDTLSILEEILSLEETEIREEEEREGCSIGSWSFPFASNFQRDRSYLLLHIVCLLGYEEQLRDLLRPGGKAADLIQARLPKSSMRIPNSKPYWKMPEVSSAGETGLAVKIGSNNTLPIPSFMTFFDDGVNTHDSMVLTSKHRWALGMVSSFCLEEITNLIGGTPENLRSGALMNFPRPLVLTAANIYRHGTGQTDTSNGVSPESIAEVEKLLDDLRECDSRYIFNEDVRSKWNDGKNDLRPYYLGKALNADVIVNPGAEGSEDNPKKYYLINKPPLLLSISCLLGQVAAFPTKALSTAKGNRASVDKASLALFLCARVEDARRGGNKKTDFETIYREYGFIEEEPAENETPLEKKRRQERSRQQKKRIRDATEERLKVFKEENLIEGWSFYPDKGQIKGVIIHPKREESKKEI